MSNKVRINRSGKGGKVGTHVANVHHLTRIIVFMREKKIAIQKEIIKATGMSMHIKSAIGFLTANRILLCITGTSRSSSRRYVLNPKYLEMRDGC